MTTDIDRDLVIRWVKRLRDPLSRQAKQVLRSTEDHAAMCCLGHLCDIVDPDGWGMDIDGEWKFRYESKVLPVSVKERVGLSSVGEYINGGLVYDWAAGNNPRQCLALTTANDSGWTLPEIADALVTRYDLTPTELA
jgi:hypothetical protein